MSSVNATRKSIKKYFSFGAAFASGFDSPLTVHAVDDDLFPRIWALLVESNVVEGDLTRTTREKVCTMTSKKNNCPMCITAHQLMEVTTEQTETHPQDKEVLGQSLLYANMLLESIHDGSSVSPLTSQKEQEQSLASLEDTRFSQLTNKAKVEVALSVLTFQHFNRIVLALLGEELTTNLFYVPRSIAREVERPSIMKYLNHVIKVVIKGSVKTKHESGLVEYLFAEDGTPDLSILPPHLAGVVYGGEHRANAIARLFEWVQNVYESKLSTNLPQAVVDFADDAINGPPSSITKSGHMQWLCSNLSRNVKAAFSVKTAQLLAWVLTTIRYSPRLVYKSSQWKDLVKRIGKEKARLCVLWYALRVTFEEAKGFYKSD